MTVPESLNPLFFSEDAQSSQAGNALTSACPVPSSHSSLCCFLPSCGYTEMLKYFLFLSVGPKASLFLCSSSGFSSIPQVIVLPCLFFMCVWKHSKLALTGVCNGTKIKKRPPSLHIPVCDLDNSLLSLPIPNWKWDNDRPLLHRLNEDKASSLVPSRDQPLNRWQRYLESILGIVLYPRN